MRTRNEDGNTATSETEKFTIYTIKLKFLQELQIMLLKKNFSNFIFSCFENNIIRKGFLLFVLHIENKTASDNSDTSVATPNCNLRKFKVN
jgi:hypothetical protein